MALTPRSIQFPLFTGRDGGTDSKMVRQNVLESKNVIQTKDGALAKRPGIGQGAKSSGGGCLIGYDGKFLHTSSVTFNVGVESENKINRPALVTMDAAPLVTVGYTAEGDDNGPIVWGDYDDDISDVKVQYSTEVTVNLDGASKVVGSRGENIPVAVQKFSGGVRWHEESGTLKRELNTVSSNLHKAGGHAWDVESFTYNGFAWDIVAYADSSATQLVVKVYKDGSLDGTYTITGSFYAASKPALSVVCIDGQADCLIIWATTSTLQVTKVDITDGTIAYTESAASSPSGLAGNAASIIKAHPSDNTDNTSVIISVIYHQSLSEGASTPYSSQLVIWDIDVSGALSSNSVKLCSIPVRSDPISHMFKLPTSGQYAMWIRWGDLIFHQDYEFDYTDADGNSYTGYPTVRSADTACLIRIFPGTGFGYEHMSFAFPRAVSVRCNPRFDDSLNVLTYNSANTLCIGQPSHAYRTGSSFVVAMPYGAVTPQLRWVSITEHSEGRVPHVKLNNQLMYGHGALRQSSDGVAIQPAVEGDAYKLAGNTTGGSMTSTGVYLYIFVPLYDSPAGNVRGTPSAVLPVTLGASDTEVDITRYELNTASYKHNVVGYEVFRTEADGSVFYKVTNLNLFTTYTDGLADTDLIQNAQIYTKDYVTGAQHEAPPHFRDIAEHGGRFWGIAADDYSRLYYTALRPSLVAGVRDGPSWSLFFTVSLPYIQPRRLYSFGGVLLLLADEGLWGVPGRGPDSSDNGSFPAPQRFVGAPGISDPNSVVAAGNLLLYKSKKGWYTLDQGFNATYVGGPVEDYNSNNVLNTVRRGDEKVQILLDDNNTCLIYDPELRTWDVWVYLQSLRSIVEYGERIAASDASFIYQETASDFGGSGDAYTMQVKTRWFNLEQITGYQRLYEMALLGEYKDSHTVRVKVYYDYVETAAETLTLAVSSDPAPYLLRVQPQRQDCKAVRFDIEEVSPSGTYESATWSAVQLKVGVEEGAGQALYTDNAGSLEAP